MIDWTTVSQYVLAFIGGSGLTGLVTALCQARVRSKETARERFGKLVLTEGFFESLTSILELYDFYVLSKKLEKGESGLIAIGGKLIEFHSTAELGSVVDMLASRVGAGITKERTSGAFFLMPRQVREAFVNLLNAIPRMGVSVDEAQLEVFGERILELNSTLAKTLGIGELD